MVELVVENINEEHEHAIEGVDECANVGVAKEGECTIMGTIREYGERISQLSSSMEKINKIIQNIGEIKDYGNTRNDLEQAVVRIMIPPLARTLNTYLDWTNIQLRINKDWLLVGICLQNLHNITFDVDYLDELVTRSVLRIRREDIVENKEDLVSLIIFNNVTPSNNKIKLTNKRTSS